MKIMNLWFSNGDYDVELSSAALQDARRIDKSLNSSVEGSSKRICRELQASTSRARSRLKHTTTAAAAAAERLDHHIKFKSYSTLVKLQKPFLEIMKKPTNVHKSQHERDLKVSREKLSKENRERVGEGGKTRSSKNQELINSTVVQLMRSHWSMKIAMCGAFVHSTNNYDIITSHSIDSRPRRRDIDGSHTRPKRALASLSHHTNCNVLCACMWWDSPKLS